jgi:hypothetical protein
LINNFKQKTMALINPLAESLDVSNTGFEGSKQLEEIAGVILVPASAKWNAADMDDFPAFIEEKIHAAAADRWFPVFADLKNVEIGNESDTEESFPDGTKELIRLGGYNLMMSFKKGGEPLAKALIKLNNLDYRPIIVDKLSKFKVRLNADGTYSGLKTTDLGGGAPGLKTFAVSYMNKLRINISVDEFIKNAEILKDDSDLTELTGLIDCEVTEAAAATTTKLKVGVQTKDKETDLVALLGDAWADATNFVVYNVTDSTTVTPSGVAVVSGIVEITIAAQTSGDVVRVSGGTPAALLANDISGYEITDSVSITIP